MANEQSARVDPALAAGNQWRAAGCAAFSRASHAFVAKSRPRFEGN